MTVAKIIRGLTDMLLSALRRTAKRGRRRSVWQLLERCRVPIVKSRGKRRTGLRWV